MRDDDILHIVHAEVAGDHHLRIEFGFTFVQEEEAVSVRL